MEQALVRDTKLALNSLKTAHLVCDLSLNVLTANESAWKFIDSRSLSSKSNNILDLMDTNRISECLKALEDTANDGLSRSVINSQLVPREIYKCDFSRIGKVILVQIYDITENHKLILREQIESSRNDAILQSINNSILVIDFADQTLISNQICDEVLGDYKEIRNILLDLRFDLQTFNYWGDLAISETTSELISSAREVWLTGEPKIDLISKLDEKGRYLLVRKISRWDYAGTPRGIIVSGSDISEEVKYKEEVETSQLQVRELLKNLNIWIAVLDESTGEAELYFPDGSRLKQPKFVENLSAPKQDLIKAAISELYENGFATIVAPSEAGDRIIRTSISFASNGDKGSRKILAINSDVTEKLQFEELENRKEQMAQIQKFAQGIAHDFGNISQSIQGFTKLLSKEINSEQGKKILENLQVSAKRALNVSQKISEVSRIQVLENTNFNLLDHLMARRSDLQELLGSAINLELQFEEGLNGQIYANPEQIERIVENIVENARHAISGSGKVKLFCSEDSISNDLILKISNDGPAIPKKIADRIFMPFVTSRKEGGTGLGLYLAFEYLNSCGGKIELQNQNHDVSFKITLPRDRRK